jgi:hypothetical protein
MLTVVEDRPLVLSVGVSVLLLLLHVQQLRLHQQRVVLGHKRGRRGCHPSLHERQSRACAAKRGMAVEDRRVGNARMRHVRSVVRMAGCMLAHKIGRPKRGHGIDSGVMLVSIMRCRVRGTHAARVTIGYWMHAAEL